MRRRQKITVYISVVIILFVLNYFSQTFVFYLFPIESMGETEGISAYLEALIPFGIVLLMSIIGIVISIILRNRIIHSNPSTARFADRRRGIHIHISKPKFRFNFTSLRWIIMAFFFLLSIFGVRIIHKVIPNAILPTFGCPMNTNTPVDSHCYYLSHLNELFTTTSISDILLFFLTFILAVVLVGKVICGFICPIGFLQDVLYKIRQFLGIEAITFDEEQYDFLKVIKWAVLTLFFCAPFIGADFCNICPFISIMPALAGVKVAAYLSGYMAVLMIIASFFKRRFFCTICPIGFLVGLLNRISIFKLKKDTQSCTECGACYEACPMGIKTIYTERDKVNVTTPDCIMCGECIKKCPENNALAITFCKKNIYIASRKQFFENLEEEDD